MSGPEFKVIPKREASARRKPRRERRSWTDLITTLAANADTGKVVFVKDDEVNDADIKYLTLALSRRGKGERLRSQRENVDSHDGRLLWVETVV